MITSCKQIGKVPSETRCRLSVPRHVTTISDLEVFPETLLINQSFDTKKVFKDAIFSDIFANDSTTKPKVDRRMKCQNFLRVRYTGPVPLDLDEMPAGTQFILRCADGDTSYASRTVGTERSMRRAENRTAAQNVYYPTEDIYS